MTSVWDAVKSVVGSLTDEEPQPPLHIGEAMMLWAMLTLYEEGQVIYKMCTNTSADPELKHAIENAEAESKEDIDMIRSFLIKEGVPLPPVSQPKPDASAAAIPPGAKFTDEELANLVMGKISAAIVLCGQALAESLRTDVGLIVLSSQARLLKFAAPYKALMNRRGWLKIPPPYPSSVQESTVQA